MLGGDILNIDLTRLNNKGLEYIDINETIIIEQSQLKDANILELNDAKAVGILAREDQSYYLDLSISGIMVLPCSLTLKPVPYPFTTKVEGMVMELFSEIGEIVKNNQNTIDILPIIWENILMEIPMKVISPEVGDMKMSGEGWRLITDEEDSKDMNPELEKLRDLL